MENDRIRELDLRSDDIKELIGFMPDGLIRWASGAFLLVLLILLGVSWFVKYPDIVSLPVVLTTENPPIRSYSKVSGKIDKIFVNDSTSVIEGQQLALIESNAKYDDIVSLKNYVSTLENSNYQGFYTSKPIEGLLLGNIQSSYIRFIDAHNSFSINYAQTIDKIKSKALQNEINENKKMYKSLSNQQDLLKNELLLSEKNVERNKQLYSSGQISLLALENEVNRYLQMKRQLEGFNSNLSNSKIHSKELETQIVDIQQNKQMNIDNRFENLKSALIGLKNDIQLWEQTHFINASIRGIVSIPPTTQLNKTIAVNEELFTIIPDSSSGKIIGLLEIPANLPGKIAIGAKVNIKLDGYPFLKYGLLQGSLKSMTLAPVKNTYLAEITLPRQAITSSNMPINFRQEIRGTADIITEDKSVFMRLFERVGNIFK